MPWKISKSERLRGLQLCQRVANNEQAEDVPHRMKPCSSVSHWLIIKDMYVRSCLHTSKPLKSLEEKIDICLFAEESMYKKEEEGKVFNSKEYKTRYSSSRSHVAHYQLTISTQRKIKLRIIHIYSDST